MSTAGTDEVIEPTGVGRTQRGGELYGGAAQPGLGAARRRVLEIAYDITLLLVFRRVRADG